MRARSRKPQLPWRLARLSRLNQTKIGFAHETSGRVGCVNVTLGFGSVDVTCSVAEMRLRSMTVQRLRVDGFLLPWPRWLRKDAEVLPCEGILECHPRQKELRGPA
jgi:hypothetical protein